MFNSPELEPENLDEKKTMPDFMYFLPQLSKQSNSLPLTAVFNVGPRKSSK